MKRRDRDSFEEGIRIRFHLQKTNETVMDNVCEHASEAANLPMDKATNTSQNIFC